MGETRAAMPSKEEEVRVQRIKAMDLIYRLQNFFLQQAKLHKTIKPVKKFIGLNFGTKMGIEHMANYRLVSRDISSSIHFSDATNH